MKKMIGYILFILSFVVWGIIALLPFLDITKVQVASFTTILLIVGEILFWSSLLFLGKDFMQKLKEIFTRKKN